MAWGQKYGLQLDAKTGGDRVQVKANFAGYCPLFLDEDVLSINANVVARGQRLYDATTSALHCLRPEGALVMNELIGKTTFSQLKQATAEAGVRPLQLSDLLGFLNLVGCLNRERSFVSQCRSCLRQLNFRQRHKPLYRRVHASLSSIAWQTMLVCLPVILTSAFVGALIVATGALSFTEGLKLIIAWNVLLVGSIYAHETAHYVVLQNESIRSDVVRHGLRIGLLHRALDPTTEIFLALAGPLAGLLSCAIFITVSQALDFRAGTFLGGAIALLHLCSLLPWYGDGTNLRLALHQWRRA